MELIVIGTGSSGNCYLLNHEGHKLVLDLGMPMKDLMMAGGGLEGIDGCLVTHEHGDHARAVPDALKYGLRTYATRGTINAMKAGGSFLQRVEIGKPYLIGGYTVIPIPTQHDAAEPCGFLIRHDGTGIRVLYATDTYYLRNTFPGVNFWLVECNYCDELAHEQEMEKLNLQERQMLNRLRRSHMSLKRLKQTLAANDLSKTRKIILLHLSDGRSDETRMVREITEQTGIETIAADRGMVINLDLTPF